LREDTEYITRVVKNLKETLDVKSDRQLALKLDMLPASFSNTIKRGLLPLEKIFSYAKEHNLSLDEIFLFSDKKKQQIQLKSEHLTKVTLLDNESVSIFVPYIFISSQAQLRAFLNDKKIYILDINEKEVNSSNYWLIKSNDIYYAMVISIDLDGSYILKDDNNNTRKISIEDFSKFEVIGKIHFKFVRELFI